MRGALLLMSSVLVAIGIGIGALVAAGSKGSQDGVAAPALYQRAKPQAISRFAALQSLARSEVKANEDANVHNGLIVLTTRQNAAGGDRVNTDQPVCELVINGRFTCEECSTTRNAKSPTGSYLTISVDRSTTRVTDFGIDSRRPAIPSRAVIYSFTF